LGFGITGGFGFGIGFGLGFGIGFGIGTHGLLQGLAVVQSPQCPRLSRVLYRLPPPLVEPLPTFPPTIPDFPLIVTIKLECIIFFINYKIN